MREKLENDGFLLDSTFNFRPSTSSSTPRRSFFPSMSRCARTPCQLLLVRVWRSFALRVYGSTAPRPRGSTASRLDGVPSREQRLARRRARSTPAILIAELVLARSFSRPPFNGRRL